MVEVRWNTSHHAGANAEARIKSRLKNIPASKPSAPQAQAETNPVRTITNTYFGGSQHAEGSKGDK